ncbi:MAG: hypothetical protein M3467_09950, partial [Actinomycetota bacterium]|nr:hypothetical protein [Actinomycetota bacterium]
TRRVTRRRSAGADLVIRAPLRSRSGRKLHIAAEMMPAGQPEERLCDGEGLFVTIPPERLGLPSTGAGRVGPSP